MSHARPHTGASRVWTAALLGAITTLGAALRVYHLGYKSLWVDEANLYWIAQGTAADVIHANAHGNSAPPLFALGLRLVQAFGESEAVLRSLSCVAGIAAIPVVYVLARELLPPAAAAFAAFLVAVAPAQVGYAQQLREYSLAVLLTALLLFFFARFRRRPSVVHWLGLSLGLMIGVFTQYGVALVALSLNVIVALEWAAGTVPRQQLAWWAGAQLLGLLATAAVYELSLRQHFSPGGFGAHYLAHGYWDGSLGSLSRLVATNSSQLLSFAFPAPLLLLALIVLGLLRINTEKVRLGGLLLIVPVAVTLGCAVLRFYPYLGQRQCIFLTVMLYVFAGFGFETVRQLDRRGLVAVGLVLWMSYEGLTATWRYLHSTEPFHLRPVIATLVERYRDGDRIYVYHGATSPFRYYYRRGGWISGVYSPGDLEGYRQQIRDLLAAPGRLWIVLTTCRAGECPAIREAAAAARPVRSVAQESGAALYLAE